MTKSHENAEPGTVYNPFLYDATDDRLQYFFLTGIVVAGKVARQQQDKLQKFTQLLRARVGEAPHIFSAIRKLITIDGVHGLNDLLKQVKMGQYTRITAAFTKAASPELDLRTCTRDQLCEIPGVGMKTASFFILFTRPKAGIACLDTHILAYMREKQLAPGIPSVTPGSKALYLALEKVFLKHCYELDRDPAELDFAIWLERNHGDKRNAS